MTTFPILPPATWVSALLLMYVGDMCAQTAELLHRFPGWHVGGRPIASDSRFLVFGEPVQLSSRGRLAIYDLKETDPDSTFFVPEDDTIHFAAYGAAVDVDDGVALAGAPQTFKLADGHGNRTGAAQVINLRFGSGVLLHTLFANDGAAGDAFGNAVAIDGQYGAVAANQHDHDGTIPDGGAVYVFDMSSGGVLWKLVPSDLVADDRFGSQLDINGKWLIARGQSGRAYVFDLETGVELRELMPANGCVRGDGDVALDGRFAAVGCVASDSVSVFDITTGQELWQTEGDDLSLAFGKAVDLLGGTLAVGAPALDREGGIVHVFDVLTGVELSPLQPPWDEEEFGRTLALLEDGIVIGDDIGDATVWSYQVPPTVGLVGHTIVENLPAGTRVGEVETLRLGGEVDSFVVRLLDDAGGAFQLVQTDSTLELQSRRAFDFEVEPRFTIEFELRLADGRASVTAAQISVLDDLLEDFDGDGLTEAQEESVYLTSDLFRDSDGDGFSDDVEVAMGTDPSSTIQQVIAGAGDGALPLAIANEMILVGVSSDDAAGVDHGALRLYRHQPWQVFGRLLATDGRAGDLFGEALAAHESSVVVGATGVDPAGSVYAFDLLSGRQVLALTPANPVAGDVFGKAVALNGDLVLVNVGNDVRGMVEVFDRETGAPLEPLQGQRAGYGAALAVDDDYVLIGSPAPSGEGVSGEAHVVHLPTRELVATLSPPVATESGFGSTVAIGEAWWLVGSLGDGDDAGNVYVYDRISNALVHQLQGLGDEALPSFGHALAVDEQRAVVGAWNGQQGGAWLYDLRDGSLLTAFGRGIFGSGVIGRTVAINDGVVAVSGTGSNNRGELLVYEVPDTENGPFPTTFLDWEMMTFTSEERSNVLISGLEADPDADGLSNLGEYAFGGNPKQMDDAASFQMLAIDFESGRVTLSYERGKNRSDVSYEISLSRDLERWEPASAYPGIAVVETTRLDLPLGREKVELRLEFGEEIGEALILVLTVRYLLD